MKIPPMAILGRALDALNQELEADGTRESLCEVTVLHGETMILDYGAESCGGMGWVRLVSGNPTATFPNAPQAGTCAMDLAFAVEMGVIRPAPKIGTFQKRIILPTADEQAAATSLALDDMAAMHRALKAFASEMENFVLGSYTPIGPQEGTVGGSWSFTVGEELED